MSFTWQSIRTLILLAVVPALGVIVCILPVSAASPPAPAVPVRSVPSSFAASVPTVSDATISSVPQLPLQRYPAIAYNHEKNEYLVVWWNNTIHGRIFKANEQNQVIPSSGAIHLSTALSGEERLAVVYNSFVDEYLVVWKGRRDLDVTFWDIYAQRIATDGRLLGENIAIASEIEEQFVPVVAFNSRDNQYLIAWADLRDRQANDYDIYGQFVSGTGERQRGNFVIAANQRWQAYPAIGYNSSDNEYMVVWQEDERFGVPDNIMGQRVRGTGEMMGGPIIISDAKNRQRSPALAYNAGKNQYLVVWYDYRNDPLPDPTIDPDIYGQLLLANGTLVNGPLTIKVGLGAQFWPVVVSDGSGRYLVTWFDNSSGSMDIRARALDMNGTPLGVDFRAHEASGATQEWPVVAYGTFDQKYWITWHDQRADAQNWQIYGSHWSADFTKLGNDFALPPDASQTPLKGNASISLTGPTTVTVNGKFIYTYQATVKPVTATLPLRFEWFVADQSTVTNIRSSVTDIFSITTTSNILPEVNVTATDVEGNSVSTIKRDTYEPNNPCSLATPINPDLTYTSYLPTADDIDYYKITVNERFANLVVILQEPVDYELELLDACPEQGGITRAIGGIPNIGEEKLNYNVGTNPGVYYLRIHSKNGSPSTQPYTLRAEIQSTDLNKVQTLFLVNTPALQTAYGFTRTGKLLDKLQSLSTHALVQGVIIQVNQAVTVTNAYTEWQTALADTTKANAVTAAIKAYVLGLLKDFPKVQQGGYLVIVGDDRMIPFRRLAIQPSSSTDLFWTSERIYAEKFLRPEPRTTVGAALYDQQTLSDDYYADFTASAEQDYDFSLPDLAIGRLVETPEEMITVTNAFIQADGVIKLNRGVVAGYDFVIDAAEEQCQKLRAVGMEINCLVKSDWSAQNFKELFFKTPADLFSLNGHTAHYIYWAPDKSQVSPDDVLNAGDLSHDLFYTIGCQAGLTVPPSELQELDFAQAFARKGATYIANTGWGYGMVDTLGLSERVSTLFTVALTEKGEVSVGHALREAKTNYWLRESRFDYYDEKVLSELTLYGLPMLRFKTTAVVEEQSTAARLVERGYRTEEKNLPLAALSDPATVRISYTPTITSKVRMAQGDYYTGTGYLLANPLEPLQPGLWASLKNSQGSARGVLLINGLFTQEFGFNPLIGVADDLNPFSPPATNTEPGFTASGFYPPLPHILNQVNTLNGEHEEILVLSLGQFDSNSATERLFKRITVDVFYSSDSDTTPPQIGTMLINQTVTGQLTISVPANDGQGVGLHRVIATYATKVDTNSQGTWTTVELTPSAPDGSWAGVLPIANSSDWFLIQAVDKAGNVSVVYWTNKVYLPAIRR